MVDKYQTLLNSKNIKFIINIRYQIIKNIIRTFLFIYNGVSVKGYENIDNNNYIFAVNHFSFYDLFIIVAAVKGKSISGIKKEFFKNIIPGILYSLINGVPLQNSKYNKDSIIFIIKKINRGYNFLISPAGSVSKNGTLQEFKHGVSYIAFKTKTPVVPVAIINSNKVLPYHHIIPLPYKLKVKIGKPIITNFSNANKENIKNYTMNIKNEIELLLNSPDF